MISVQCFIHTSLWSVNERQEWRNFPPCVQQTQIKYVFQHFCLSEGLRTGTIWSQPPKLIGRGKCNPTVIKQMKMTSVAPHHGSSMLAHSRNDIRGNVGGGVCKKGKEKKGPKFADVWRQIKSWAALQLFFIWWRAFLNVSVASVAVRCERRCTKILPSIQSVLIRLACPSASSRIWISGRAGAGVAHVPGSLRVPSTACQYAQNTADQCLLNHFPNRGNDNYKKWRLCTLCKCCAMTLEPNGPSY